MGPKGTKSKLHYDSDHNLFVQIYGYKKIRLISPVYSKNCYPINKSWYDAYSPIDVENPDLERCPDFDSVEILETIVGPGDMIYIPQQWWHDIRSQSVSISANFWWVSWQDFGEEIWGEFCHRFLTGEDSFDPNNSYLTAFWKNFKRDWLN